MGLPTAFTRPEKMTREEIQNEIRTHQEKVRWFEEELVGIKSTFSKRHTLPRFEVEELKKRRRTLGILKERHQEKIRELKKLREGLLNKQ